MILADTSIWVDHLRAVDDGLARLLAAEQVLGHPLVVGELALGHIPRRKAVLAELQALPQAEEAAHLEVLQLIDLHGLIGLGVGYVDICLLASARITPGAKLWTRDRRLRAAALRLGVAADEEVGPGMQE